MFEDATFAEVLDDLASRFIINVPEEELQEIARICFQIEQAHWFYDDFVREENPSLPSMTLKTFAGRMFKHCPLLSQWAHDSDTAYQTFLEYKFKVPVCGAIILNRMLDKAILVKGWSSRSSWGFPRGKINKDEPEWQCAQREVIEETGFDILPYLVEEDRIEITQADQKVVLYIISGIEEDTRFEPTVRKEISQIQWHNIADLPCGGGRPDRKNGATTPGKPQGEKESRYYLIKPFVKRIKTWVAHHPERIGVAAVAANGHRLPAAAGRRSDSSPDDSSPGDSSPGDRQRAADGAQAVARPGPMSVQELFDTVSRARSPPGRSGASVAPELAHGSAAGATAGPIGAAGYAQHCPPFQPMPYAGPPPPQQQQHQQAATPGPGGSAASLLQTLIGGPAAAARGDMTTPPQQPPAGGRMATFGSLMQQSGITGTPPSLSANYGASGVHGISAAGQQQQPLTRFAFDTAAIMKAFSSGP